MRNQRTISIYGVFAIERYKIPKKLKFWFISQKCSKYYNLFRFIINSFFIFFRVLSLSIAKAPYARINGPGASPLQKTKRTVWRLTDIQEEQFSLFFQD